MPFRCRFRRVTCGPTSPKYDPVEEAASWLSMGSESTTMESVVPNRRVVRHHTGLQGRRHTGRNASRGRHRQGLQPVRSLVHQRQWYGRRVQPGQLSAFRSIYFAVRYSLAEEMDLTAGKCVAPRLQAEILVSEIGSIGQVVPANPPEEAGGLRLHVCATSARGSQAETGSPYLLRDRCGLR